MQVSCTPFNFSHNQLSHVNCLSNQQRPRIVRISEPAEIYVVYICKFHLCIKLRNNFHACSLTSQMEGFSHRARSMNGDTCGHFVSPLDSRIGSINAAQGLFIVFPWSIQFHDGHVLYGGAY